MLLRSYFIALLLCCSFYAQSQSKTEKKADKYYNQALTLKAERKHAAACKAMDQSIKYSPTNADAYSLLGQWYFEAHQFSEAAVTFRRGTAFSRNGGSRFARPLARSLIYTGNAAEALQLINNYATLRDSADWNFLRRQANFVAQAYNNSWGIWPQNMGIRVNTEYPELFPSMAVDTQYLYFTRRIRNMDEDLYFAQADSCGGWLAARNMGDPPNSPSQESAQFISADGHYLFFTRCENRSENGAAEGGCDLFMAYRPKMDTSWTIAQPFGLTINTTAYEGMPSLSPDNRELYFVSDRPGGYGGYDIYYSQFENGLWQLPVNAGPGINTPGNETTPYIATDNNTLYFASDYWPGMGGTDLFMSRRTGTGAWGIAQNMGYPINTPYDEKSEYISLDARTLYFASDRNGPAGNYDLYQVPIPPVGAPAPMSYLQGRVMDSLTRTLLNSAAMFICNATTGDTLYELRSNRGDASYVITLQPLRQYAIHTARTGYQSVSDTVNFTAAFTTKPLTHNVVMLPIGYNPIVPINDSLIATVHFDVNITELSVANKQLLQQQLSPWLEEKGIVIYVNAYTDNSGTPMINEGLSYKRAGIIAQEIISSGFEETSVVAKGWGEANPIETNDTEEGRYKNRRVEVIIRR